MIDDLEQEGYSIVPGVLGATQLTELREWIEPLLVAGPSAGIRGLAQKIPGIRSLSESQSVRALVEPVLGSGARLIRSVLFNKTPGTNWQVAWHQDLAIPVQRRMEVEGFVSWSVKEGVLHVQPPVALLEQMLTVRLHLDAADQNNGALWVSPGSHCLGRVPADEAAAVAARHGKRLCAVGAGDALLFRPLLLHASRKAVCDHPRRIVHLEFAGVVLPEPLAWHDTA